jgi:hypothetical protein
MDVRHYFAIALGISLFNGLMSPWLPWVMIFLPFFMPDIIPLTREWLFYGGSFILAMGTLLAGGIFCAIWESFTEQREPSERSMVVWILGVLLFTTPSLLRLTGNW